MQALHVRHVVAYTRSMSLTTDDLADMKQLMESLLRAQEKRIDAKIESLEQKMDKRFTEQDRKFEAMIEDMDAKLDDIILAVGDQLAQKSGESETHTEQIDEHERRITRLETSVA